MINRRFCKHNLIHTPQAPTKTMATTIYPSSTVTSCPPHRLLSLPRAGSPKRCEPSSAGRTTMQSCSLPLTTQLRSRLTDSSDYIFPRLPKLTSRSCFRSTLVRTFRTAILLAVRSNYMLRCIGSGAYFAIFCLPASRFS
jgi:hypothetical protein